MKECLNMNIKLNDNFDNIKESYLFSEIAKKPAYGRELAKRVGLAPCTVSQYLTSLNGTGLLDSLAVGKKIIYSVNRQRVDSFIAELQKILHGETE